MVLLILPNTRSISRFRTARESILLQFIFRGSILLIFLSVRSTSDVYAAVTAYTLHTPGTRKILQGILAIYFWHSSKYSQYQIFRILEVYSKDEVYWEQLLLLYSVEPCSKQSRILG